MGYDAKSEEPEDGEKTDFATRFTQNSNLCCSHDKEDNFRGSKKCHKEGK